MKLMREFQAPERIDSAHMTVDRYNSHQANLLLQAGLHGFTYTASFIDRPGIWDTGASYGLTPFQGYFIDYEECNLSVKDISKNNMVVGI